MTFSSPRSRRSSPKEKRPEPSPPSNLPETHWTRVKSKFFHRRDHQATNYTTRLDATMSTETSTDEPKRRLLRQIIWPRPSVPPLQSTTNRHSQDNVIPADQEVDSLSYRQVPQDTSFSNFVSEYEYVTRARTRAKTFGEARSAERRARTLDLDANTGEHVETRFSHQPAPVLSSNTVGLIERCHIPPRELSSTDAPDLMNPSPWYEREVPIECLRTGSMAQAQRRRLRAQIRRARLVAEDLANPGFSSENLSILGWAGPVETDGVAVDHADESASEIAGSVFAVAPTAADAGLYAPSPEPIVQTSPSDVHATTQPSQFHESFDTETPNFDPTRRNSRVSSSFSHSVFEYDHLVSDPARTVENPASLNPAEEKDGVECERSVYDPVHQWFSLEKLNTQGVTSSAESCERNVDSGWIESARTKEGPFVPVAPIQTPDVPHAENGKVVTQPTPPITLRPQYPQRQRSTNARTINPDSSDLGLPDLSPGADGRDIDTEWAESAGEVEARSSFPAAPLPHTALLRIDPCYMVILVTPPSPPTTIRPSLSHKYAKRAGMNSDTSRPVELASAASQGDNPGLDIQHPGILPKSLPVKNYSRPFRHETGQRLGSAVYTRPLQRTDSQVFMSQIQGKTEAQNAHVKGEALSTSSPFGPLDETEAQLTFFDMLALGGTIDNTDQTVDGAEKGSAVDEAEPSVSVEPVSALSSWRSTKVKRSIEEPMPRPIHHRVRALTSRVTSSLHKWGKAMSRSSVRRAAWQPEGNTPFNPDSDSLEGFVSSRGPSPDCIGLNDALALPQSNVWSPSVTN